MVTKYLKTIRNHRRAGQGRTGREPQDRRGEKRTGPGPAEGAKGAVAAEGAGGAEGTAAAGGAEGANNVQASVRQEKQTEAIRNSTRKRESRSSRADEIR